MNTRSYNLARTSRFLTAAVSLAAVLPAAAQPAGGVYDRILERSDITVSASPDGTGWVIDVLPSAMNSVLGATLNLSATVGVFVNDEPVIVAIRWLPFTQTGGECSITYPCSGGGCVSASSCKIVYESFNCWCASYYDRVVSPSLPLVAGDVITVVLVAVPGSEPEVHTGNDQVSFVFTPPAPCPADFNGADGATVQDIYDFLFAWNSGLASADFNGADGVTVQDIYDFLAAWTAGCP